MDIPSMRVSISPEGTNISHGEKKIIEIKSRGTA